MYLEDKNIQAEKTLNVRGGYAISNKIMYQEVRQDSKGKYYFVPHYINGNCGQINGMPEDAKFLFKVYKNTLLRIVNKEGQQELYTYLTNASGNKVEFLPLNECRNGKKNIKPRATTNCKEISLVKLSKLGKVIL